MILHLHSHVPFQLQLISLSPDLSMYVRRAWRRTNTDVPKDKYVVHPTVVTFRSFFLVPWSNANHVDGPLIREMDTGDGYMSRWRTLSSPGHI